MPNQVRSADIVARSLDAAGLTTIFTLSGNHIMPLFDAAIGTRLRLIHVRHEAAAVHMADAWGRLTGRCGIAWVSGGAGFTNAAAALCTAQQGESPLVLVSGHAGVKEIGRGAFQELRQAEMAAPVAKASWVVRSAETLGSELAEAVRIALSGRPGPVHLSLPFDLLEEKIADAPSLWPDPAVFAPKPQALAEGASGSILAALSGASRPLILAGPQLCHAGDLAPLQHLEAQLGVPVVPMESPRGINDPRLGAFAEVLRQADLIVLLGKAHDFTLRFGEPPFVDAACRFMAIDADAAMLERVRREKAVRLVLAALADAKPAALSLIAEGKGRHRNAAWLAEVQAAVAYRPPGWETLMARAPGKLHPAELCRSLAPVFTSNPNAVLVCDGGEIGQWPQAMLAPRRRIINGPAGSIGASIPFAVAARAADPLAPVIAVMGDGTFGFHMAEFDTAVRCNLPFVAVVGNDQAWNAEHQIQLRDYGADRAHGCDLLPTRYDLAAAALGGHGELVTRAADLPGAIERALASGKPACVNVMIERVPAPIVRRQLAAG
ncbi:MAG: thiamine pyrophosphate-binding protein [Hyphomonadaceae bacterium]|nr:thiamine pyrophosphate-binding protein [Hyphomonadaceae bacterium]